MVNLARTGKLRPGGVQGEYSRGKGTSMGWQKGDGAKKCNYSKQQQYKVKGEARLNELVLKKCTGKSTAVLISWKKALE